MSNKIQREVVEATFDPKGLVKGIEKSIHFVEQLKASLNFDKSAQSLSRLEQSADSVKFGGMAKAVDGITSRLSTMGIVGATVIANITNSIFNASKRMAQSLLLGPIKMGLEEYEIQMNAIQTILANTSMKGTTLDDVNSALGELNAYADKTIYNFSQMTDSVGKFTAAGVALDTSVSAIKGISNLAALSGSNAQQASTAMYQLSQAIAAGKVTLMDWNSVVNAGMGGQIFQDAIVETARNQGIAVDSLIEKNGSFRASLQEGWLTSEVMLEALSKFTGDLNAEQLKTLGYTEDQIVEIMKLAETANDAATKIKTLTQLKDTMMEALQSGWAKTWSIVFGEFDEAKELFGGIGDILGTLIGQSADARNNMLDAWKDLGGRDKLIRSFMIILEQLVNVITTIKSAFREIFPPLTGYKLYQLTVGFEKFVRILAIGETGSNNLKIVFKALFAVLDIVFMLVKAILSPIIKLTAGVGGLASGLGKGVVGFALWVTNLRDVIEKTKIFDIFVQNVGRYLGKLADTVKTLAKRFLDLNVIGKLVKWLQGITKADVVDFFWSLNDALIKLYLSVLPFVSGLYSEVERLVNSFLGMKVVQDVIRWVQGITKADIVAFLWSLNDILIKAQTAITPYVDALKDLYDKFLQLKVVKEISDILSGFTWTNIKAFFDGILDKMPIILDKLSVFVDILKKAKDKIKAFGESFLELGFVKAVLDAISNFSILGGVSKITEAGEALRGVTKWVGGLKDSLFELKDKLGGIGPYADKFRDWILEMLSNLGAWLTEGAKNVDFNGVVGLLAAGLVTGLLFSIRKLMGQAASGEWLTKVLDGFIGADSPIVSSITRTLGSVEETFKSFQTNLKADALLKIGAAIAIVVASVIALSMVDPDKLLTAMLAMSTLLTGLFGSVGVLSKIDTKSTLTSASAILVISIALLILVAALKGLSALDYYQVVDGLSAFAIGLTEMLLAIRFIGNGGGVQMVKTAAGLVVLSLALLVMSMAVSRFGEMKPDVVQQGLLTIGIALAGMIAAVKLLSNKVIEDIISAAIGIGILSASMLVLSLAVLAFGNMNPDVIVVGMATIAGLLGEFALFSNIIKPTSMIQAAIGIAILSVALVSLTATVGLLGSMGVDKLTQGLLGLGAVLVMVAATTSLMSGALVGAAAMVIVSGAILVLSMALVIMGQLRMDQMMVALAGLAGVFVIFGLAGLLLAPIVPILMGLGIAMGMIGLGAVGFGLGIAAAAFGLTLLAGSAAAIASALPILGDAIVSILPAIATAIADSVVNFIQAMANAAPQLLEAGLVLLATFLEAIVISIPMIVTAIWDLLQALLDVMVERTPDLLASAYALLISFMQGFRDNIQEIVTLGLEILVELIHGIENGMPQLVDAAFSLTLTFIESVDAAIVEYVPKIIEAGIKLGVHLVEGVVSGLLSGIQMISDTIGELVRKAVAVFKGEADIHSPSKVFYKLASWIPRGIVNAIRDGSGGVDKATSGLVDSAQNGIRKVLNDLQSIIDGSLEYEPTIRPVLDMSGVNYDSDMFNKTVKFNTGFTRRGDSDGDNNTRKGGDDGKDDGGIKFYQYNTSPKPLNAAEIYRKTKTGIAVLAARTEK